MKESNEKLQQTLAEAKKEIEELRKQRAEHCQAREKQNEYAFLKKKLVAFLAKSMLLFHFLDD